MKTIQIKLGQRQPGGAAGAGAWILQHAQELQWAQYKNENENKTWKQKQKKITQRERKNQQVFFRLISQTQLHGLPAQGRVSKARVCETERDRQRGWEAERVHWLVSHETVYVFFVLAKQKQLPIEPGQERSQEKQPGPDCMPNILQTTPVFPMGHGHCGTVNTHTHTLAEVFSGD